MCILKAFSSSKSFKEFASSTSIPVYSCKEKGAPRDKGSRHTQERYQISFDVSDREWDEFPSQVEDAIKFLSVWEKELFSFKNYYQPDDFFLDFPIYSRINSKIINQNDMLPSELIALAGKLGLGICMAIYSREAIDEL